MEDSLPEYSNEIKTELNKISANLKAGKATLVSSIESKTRIQKILKAGKAK